MPTAPHMISPSFRRGCRLDDARRERYQSILRQYAMNAAGVDRAVASYRMALEPVDGGYTMNVRNARIGGAALYVH